MACRAREGAASSSYYVKKGVKAEVGRVGIIGNVVKSNRQNAE